MPPVDPELSSSTNDPHIAKAKVTPLSTAFPVQFGQVLVVKVTQPGAAGGLATLAKDVVRWKGKSGSDIQPMRVYLGPWQPQVGIQPLAPPPFPIYQEPTPWQEPEPIQYDFFRAGSIFARVSFGAGGVQHQAYVDWPPRGLLFQVSAQYLQVDGVGTLVTPPGLDDPNLPILLAHVSPEPGGGDSIQPATYTYPPIDFQPGPGGTEGILFQVPPFARAFIPVLDRIFMNNTGITGVDIQEQGSATGTLLNTWQYLTAVGNIWPTDQPGGLPLSGMAKDVFIVHTIGGVRQPTINTGCIFLLDI